MVTEKGAVFTDKLVSWGSAPGYPEIDLTFEVDDGQEKRTLTLHISGPDAERIRQHIADTQSLVCRLGNHCGCVGQVGEHKCTCKCHSDFAETKGGGLWILDK